MSPKEIHEELIKTLGKESLSYSTVKIWTAEFKRGTENVEDDGRSGRPLDGTADKNIKSCTPRLCVLRSIASDVSLGFVAVQWILTGILGMAKQDDCCDDQKRTQLDISRYLLSCYKDDLGDFIQQVVTQDETWLHHFDQESKMKSKQWKHPGSPLLRNLRGFIQQGMC